ncbi:hypothetical protein FA13DRAFT_930830 [Coprinellus micaceus]|uniref:Uncharacterized protein n=1 Tax=Coprinellus micaceus TaxID=71717 RepID=A0A4Y7TU47_COPMI|nr:hypothetical protein FA13DRAFT_930830 [Coprinellus micaceus]
MILPRIARFSHPATLVSLSWRRSLSSAPRLLIRSVLPTQHRFINPPCTPRTGILTRRVFSDKADPSASATSAAQAEYVGPLTNTWRRLKIFSLASCGLSFTLAPFMFIIESNLPYSARFALASIAVGTSGLSTSLVAWCARPYVTELRRLNQDGTGEVLEMTTASLFLRPQVTKVYDPEFLIATRRPMAKWELATEMLLPASRMETEGKALVGVEEIVAETFDHTGNVIGRWIVSWGENGEGKCHEAGTVIRYFNVHEELLN